MYVMYQRAAQIAISIFSAVDKKTKAPKIYNLFLIDVYLCRDIHIEIFCEMYLPDSLRHQRRASVAIRNARPASTVPISQRCSMSHVGLPERKAAIEPAIITIIALTQTLITICVVPSASD